MSLIHRWLLPLRASARNCAEAKRFVACGTIDVRLASEGGIVRLAIADGELTLDETADTGTADVVLQADDASWDLFFTRSGGVAYATLFSMAFAGVVSGGELDSPLQLVGDQRKWFAYNQFLEAVLDGARTEVVTA
jgi:hypothetical protein